MSQKLELSHTPAGKSVDVIGGHLIEIDGYASLEPEQSWFWSDLKEIPVTIKYPKDDDIVPEQKNYIRNRIDWVDCKLDYEDGLFHS